MCKTTSRQRTLTISRLLVAALLVLLPLLTAGVSSTPSAASANVSAGAPVVAIDIENMSEGTLRSQRSWLLSYLELPQPPFPRPSQQELERLTRKLTTTEVFTSAQVSVRSASDDGTTQAAGSRLVIALDEKWTTIPVVRGAYGGGTPLKVVGVYDTHGLGRLFTFGAEARQYGDAQPGWVAWFRAPRWRAGGHTLGLELWQDNRIRDLYSDSGQLSAAERRVGQYKTRMTKLRLLYEQPVGHSVHHKIGVDLWGLRLTEEGFEDSAGPVAGEQVYARTGIRPLPREGGPIGVAKVALRYVYDDAVKDHFDIGGTRAIGLWGFIKYQSRLYNYLQGEVFHYIDHHPGSVIAMHAKGQWAEGEAYLSQLFLGGFDSVRGYPDGYKYGTRAGYLNLEYRRILVKNPSIHVQGLMFADGGYAASAQGWSAMSGDDAPTPAGALYALGLGLRVSYPRINRLMVRFDIAKPLTRGHDGVGIAVGLNQFFQPHKPL